VAALTGYPQFRYSIDPYGTKVKVPYTASGLGIYVALSTMDKYWYPEITRDEAGDLLRRCVDEVKLRRSFLNAIEWKLHYELITTY
jgi:20S proteasome alpha/beta subunit